MPSFQKTVSQLIFHTSVLFRAVTSARDTPQLPPNLLILLLWNVTHLLKCDTLQKQLTNIFKGVLLDPYICLKNSYINFKASLPNQRCIPPDFSTGTQSLKVLFLPLMLAYSEISAALKKPAFRCELLQPNSSTMA